MKRIKEKRGNEIVKSMNSNFAKETNQRDEDAEMQKFIEEQLRKKKEADEAAAASSQDPSKQGSALGISEAASGVTVFKRHEDALFDVPKFLIENRSSKNGKSEES